MFYLFCFCSWRKPLQIRYLLESGKAEEAELLRYPVSPFAVAFSAGPDGDGDGDGDGADIGADASGAEGGVDAGGAGGGGGGGGSESEGKGKSESSADDEKAKTDTREMQRLVGIARDLSGRGLLISVRCLLLPTSYSYSFFPPLACASACVRNVCVRSPPPHSCHVFCCKPYHVLRSIVCKCKKS